MDRHVIAFCRGNESKKRIVIPEESYSNLRALTDVLHRFSLSGVSVSVARSVKKRSNVSVRSRRFSVETLSS